MMMMMMMMMTTTTTTMDLPRLQTISRVSERLSNNSKKMDINKNNDDVHIPSWTYSCAIYTATAQLWMVFSHTSFIVRLPKRKSVYYERWQLFLAFRQKLVTVLQHTTQLQLQEIQILTCIRINPTIIYAWKHNDNHQLNCMQLLNYKLLLPKEL
jgi:hypothetical protein